MNKLYLTLIIATLLFGIIFVTSADDIIAKFTSTTTMDKASRDYLLAKLPTTMDKGQPLPKEISPAISIECNEDYCLWSAVQEGLISSYDNKIENKHCIKYEKKLCLENQTYTTKEIEEQVVVLVNKKLSDYASSSMKSELKPYVKVSEGTIIVEEKQ